MGGIIKEEVLWGKRSKKGRKRSGRTADRTRDRLYVQVPWRQCKTEIIPLDHAPGRSDYASNVCSLKKTTHCC
jgi:hypothetical protein